MKKVILFILVMISSSIVHAQSLESIYEMQRFGIAFHNQMIVTVHNDVSKDDYIVSKDRLKGPLTDQYLPFNSIYFSYRYQTTKYRGLYFNYTNSRIGDILGYMYLETMTNEYEKVKDVKDSIFSNGYLGEINIGLNVYKSKKDKLIISSGLLLTDVRLHDEYFYIGGNHLLGGAFINIDQILFNKYIFRLSAASGYSFIYFDGSMKGLKPLSTTHFTTEFIFPESFYVGFDFRGLESPNDRLALKLGYRFSAKNFKK